MNYPYMHTSYNSSENSKLFLVNSKFLYQCCLHILCQGPGCVYLQQCSRSVPDGCQLSVAQQQLNRHQVSNFSYNLPIFFFYIFTAPYILVFACIIVAHHHVRTICFRILHLLGKIHVATMQCTVCGTYRGWQ